MQRVCVGQIISVCFWPNPPHHIEFRHNMSAIFNFSSLLTVLLLLICTCAYLRDLRPTIFDGGQVRTEKKPLQTPSCLEWSENIQSWTTSIFLSAPLWKQTLQPGETRLKRTGVTGFLWKMSRIGERLSPYVGASCAIMAIHILFFKWIFDGIRIHLHAMLPKPAISPNVTLLYKIMDGGGAHGFHVWIREAREEMV